MQKLNILSLLTILSIPLMQTGCQVASMKPYTYEFQYGKTPMLKGAYAIPPKSAPSSVHRAVQAGNRIQGKPYQMGGGHRRVEDSAYDCSGAVSYTLIKAGLLRSPLTSKGFKNYGSPGRGRWITIYAKDGHTFMSFAGLRLDTSYRRDQGSGPKWSKGGRPARGYVLRHPPGL